MGKFVNIRLLLPNLHQGLQELSFVGPSCTLHSAIVRYECQPRQFRENHSSSDGQQQKIVCHVATWQKIFLKISFAKIPCHWATKPEERSSDVDRGSLFDTEWGFQSNEREIVCHWDTLSHSSITYLYSLLIHIKTCLFIVLVTYIIAVDGSRL